MAMKTTRQGVGREKQKSRTRAALILAGLKLVQAGEAPTVAEVAEAADVSRRTAYRYFPTQEELLIEVGLEHTREELDHTAQHSARLRDPEMALDNVVRAVQGSAVKNEKLLRTMVRLSLENRLAVQSAKGSGSIALRGSRRVSWIRLALTPTKPRLTKGKFERLVYALTSCIGVEAIIVLRDVHGLDAEKSIEVCRWMARSLLRAALQEGR
jgi:AcrR family transcriptional regulator